MEMLARGFIPPSIFNDSQENHISLIALQTDRQTDTHSE